MTTAVVRQGAGGAFDLSPYLLHWYKIMNSIDGGTTLTDEVGGVTLTRTVADNWSTSPVYHTWSNNANFRAALATEIPIDDPDWSWMVVWSTIATANATSVGNAWSKAPDGITQGFAMGAFNDGANALRYVPSFGDGGSPVGYGTAGEMIAPGAAGTEFRCGVGIDRSTSTYHTSMDGTTVLAATDYLALSPNFDAAANISATTYVMGATGISGAGLSLTNAAPQLFDFQIYMIEGALPANKETLLNAATKRKWRPLTSVEWS